MYAFQICSTLAWLNLASLDAAPPTQRCDVVIYGGTSSGVTAAVRTARLGRSVVLVEPSRHLGGLSAGGLGATDIGNKAAIGGLAREFYRRLGAKYGQPEAWKFEPRVAETVFNELVREAGVRVVFGERLDLQAGVRASGTRIHGIRMESGRTFSGRIFIDATYEGDLMALAGVTCTIGRESNGQYGETLNGVQVRNATKHQFTHPVDPYIVPGDPHSGLLPGIDPSGPDTEGDADHRVQAYCFRMCTTDLPENRRDWEKPAGYDPLHYELLLRNFEAGDTRVPWHPVMMPNRKTDTNNNFAISTDYIGMNYDYPAGDYAARERIWKAHATYQKGLMWTLANSPRVPADIRQHFQTWGLARDEFTDNENWPHQLYVREARRMVSDYVMTEHNCQGRTIADDPVGLAAYGMDSHNVQRYIAATGHVRNEGDVQVHGFKPYPISLRAIIPKRGECANLLVPVCVSATHIAYGSIRMEPVFMVLGDSAATAAALAISDAAQEAVPADAARPAAGETTPLQELNYPRLRALLLEHGQILEWQQ